MENGDFNRAIPVLSLLPRRAAHLSSIPTLELVTIALRRQCARPCMAVLSRGLRLRLRVEAHAPLQMWHGRPQRLLNAW